MWCLSRRNLDASITAIDRQIRHFEVEGHFRKAGTFLKRCSISHPAGLCWLELDQTRHISAALESGGNPGPECFRGLQCKKQSLPI